MTVPEPDLVPSVIPDEHGLTEASLRHAYGMFPSGVAAICALIDSRPMGLAASSFTPVSMQPALVSVCVADTSTTWPVLRTARRLGLSVLGAEQAGAARDLAARGRDRFARVEWEPNASNAVFLRGATLWLECCIQDELPAGDHDIVVLRVGSAVPFPGTSPLIFHASRFSRIGT